MPAEKVMVKAHARLHMGFFDMHGGLGRKFGSLGLSLMEPTTDFVAQRASSLQVCGKLTDEQCFYVTNVVSKLQERLDMTLNLRLDFEQAIPNHAGFGAGTQLTLALLAAIDRLHDLGLSQAQMGRLSNRGARSGIGLATFVQGGLVVDAGRDVGRTDVIPPVIARVDFPEQWRVLLILDESQQGIHGKQEHAAFGQLLAADAAVADRLCRHVLMQGLPALHEQDFMGFAQTISALQQATGAYFSPAQGGLYASPEVARVLNWLEQQGKVCFGQSSWGPTGFAIFETENEALETLRYIKAEFGQTKLGFIITSGCNTGADITL